jgi:glutathione peroxidase
MTILDTPLHTLQGEPTTLGDYRGKTLLVVNVASKCGLTPQYEGLERLQKTYGDRGFSVIGFPCNQFGEQEPGSADEIATFCSATYGVTFPMMEKVEVNGDDRNPVYEELTAVADAEGEAGDIQWNFEKFLVAGDGTILQRFRPGLIDRGLRPGPSHAGDDEEGGARCTHAGRTTNRASTTSSRCGPRWPRLVTGSGPLSGSCPPTARDGPSGIRSPT